jgi:hypothetical protein
VRRALDAYFTVPEVAAACVTRLRSTLVTSPRTILEPSAGAGAFVRCAAWAFPHAKITANDLRIRRPLFELGLILALELHAVEVRRGDFLKAELSTVDLVIGTPPYLAAAAHVRRALQLTRRGGHVAFLLRLGFLGSQARAEGLWRSPELLEVSPLAPRPSFTGGGTDQQEYAFFVWRRGYRGRAHLAPPILWRPSSPARMRGAA